MNKQEIQLKVRGVNYHIETWGSGEPLWLLHGFTGTTQTWHELAASLYKKRKVIMIDLLGHGKTESPVDSNRYRMEEQIEDLDEIRKCLEFPTIDLLGYSMGGRVAFSYYFLKREHVRKLILESSSPGLKTDEERMTRKRNDYNLSVKLVEEGIESFVDFWQDISLFETQKHLPMPIREKIRNERINQNPQGLANSLIGMGTGSQPSWWDMLEEVEIPVLLITGSEDGKFVEIATEMEKLMPHATHVNVFQAGHAIHVELPQKFGKIVDEFVLNT